MSKHLHCLFDIALLHASFIYDKWLTLEYINNVLHKCGILMDAFICKECRALLPSNISRRTRLRNSRRHRRSPPKNRGWAWNIWGWNPITSNRWRVRPKKTLLPKLALATRQVPPRPIVGLIIPVGVSVGIAARCNANGTAFAAQRWKPLLLSNEK